MGTDYAKLSDEHGLTRWVLLRRKLARIRPRLAAGRRYSQTWKWLVTYSAARVAPEHEERARAL